MCNIKNIFSYISIYVILNIYQSTQGKVGLIKKYEYNRGAIKTELPLQLCKTMNGLKIMIGYLGLV